MLVTAGFNYLQSVTPNLALGGETFWLSQAMKSGVGFAARHQGEKHIATAQIATTGLVSLNYAHRLSEKVSLITAGRHALILRAGPLCATAIAARNCCVYDPPYDACLCR